MRACKPGRVRDLPGLEQPRADERVRIDVSQPERPVVMGENAHQFASLEFAERRLLGIDFVAEHPQMPGVEAAVFVALQAQRGQVRGSWRRRGVDRAWARLRV